jgi:hypothetical protein
VRFWPGYAPVEALTSGLTRILENIEEGAYRSRKLALPAQRADFDLGSVGSDYHSPLSHIEALKTAMRHADIALKNPEPQLADDKQKRVARWLKIRILIKLKQSETVLKHGLKLASDKQKDANQDILSDLKKNYLIAADLVDKLQEYAFLYTAATLQGETNPNAQYDQPKKFKDDSDAFEKYLTKTLSGVHGDHRVFYLDSGEQALVMAGILANRFQQQATAQSPDVGLSDYQNLDSYFEVGIFGGARRSNLREQTGGSVVHADMSPVITSGNRKSQQEIKEAIKGKWQTQTNALDPDKRGVIPILDITNSSLSEVASLGAMPDNYILVESLTKHEQLGSDKFIMGRLIAVSHTVGTKLGRLDSGKFLDLAQTVVGPVANESYNPVLHKLRKQMDEALYKKADPNRFALVLHPTESNEAVERRRAREAPSIDPVRIQRLLMMIPQPTPAIRLLMSPQSSDPWAQIMQRLAHQYASSSQDTDAQAEDIL